MSYRCEICHQVTPPRTPATKVVLATRLRAYLHRPNAHRRKRHGLRQWTADPGGTGYEIAQEATACPTCAAALSGKTGSAACKPPAKSEPKLIRCEQLRELGLIDERVPCCPRCHTDAGLVGYDLPNGYRAAYCCARIEPLRTHEVAAITARIPVWAALGVLSAADPGERLLSFGGIIRFGPDGDIVEIVGAPKT